jgi:ComF family protein
MYCQRDYVETDYHLIQENPVAMHFYGRVKIENASSLLDFKKGSLSQTLLHELKYNQRKDIGIALGERFARKVKESSFLDDIEVIVPVPLHRKKLRRRGYNQSTLFAQGLASKSGIPVLEGNLIRVVDTETQTRKQRMDRIDNVSDAFQLKSPEAVQNKHCLLVDDVITTGATIESCAAVLLKEAGVRVSVAAIALG